MRLYATALAISSRRQNDKQFELSIKRFIKVSLRDIYDSKTISACFLNGYRHNRPGRKVSGQILFSVLEETDGYGYICKVLQGNQICALGS